MGTCSEAVMQMKSQLVPDMTDRISDATALHLGLPLVTRDRKYSFGDTFNPAIIASAVIHGNFGNLPQCVGWDVGCCCCC
jgi:predicted nucleic acid-binding protein